SLVENPVEREVDSRSDGFLYGLFQNGYFDNKGVDTEDYILSFLIRKTGNHRRSIITLGGCPSATFSSQNRSKKWIFSPPMRYNICQTR
ncbi:hypothetical protein, partial [Gracilibacillus suaedae]|uniref:hypothetical protein n=1 Tax=Gracilibacillus suaedae TaxID=2820273 RepID=UPI001ABDD64C